MAPEGPALTRDAHPKDGGRSGRGHADGVGAFAGQSEWHFVDYLRLLSKRRWTALSAFLGILLVTAILTYSATPIFEARAEILIEAEMQNVITFKEVVAQEMSTIEYYTTQYKILQSRALARVTMETLHLFEHPEFAPRPAEQQDAGFDIRAIMTRALRASEGVFIRVLGPQRADAVYDAPKNPEAAGVSETRAQSLAIEAFLDRLRITPVRNSRLVDVQFKSTDPMLAATVANALSQAYIDRILQFKLAASKEAADWLSNQLTEQREKVEESEKALQQYREQNTALSTEDSQLVQKLNELTTMLTRARTDRLQKELLFRQVQAGAGDRAALKAFPAIAANGAVQQVNAELSEATRKEAQLAREFGDRWPDLVALRGTIRSLEAKLDGEIENVVKLLNNDVQNAKAQEEGLIGSIEAQKSEALARNRKAIGYQSLERELASNHQIFETLMQRAKETNISSQLRTNNIRLADEATPPTSPVWPDKTRNLLFALLGGAALGVALAFVAEYMDNKLKSPEELRDDLGLRCLGMVPKIPGKAQHEPLLNNGVPSVFAEAFRAVRTNVLFSYEESTAKASGRSVVVTSTAPAEGKTLVASNLAAGLALAGQRVLLVDADMRRPRVHGTFDCPQEPGVSNLIVGNAKASEAIHKSESVPGLWLLPSGTIPPNPAELLSAPRFEHLLATLVQQFDWVIIDSPPTMAVIDASVVAHIAGGVLFVVAADKTSRPAAIKALEQLDAANAHFLGAVLNRADVKRNAFFYSPYYRREYSKYYSRPA